MSREPADLQWAAGFYSGEGSTYVYHRRETRNGKRYVWQFLDCAVGQLNRTTLEKFHAAVGGYGSITHTHTAQGKIFYQWRAGPKNAEVVALMLFPYLSTEKRWQYLRARRKMRLYRRERYGEQIQLVA